MHVARRAGWVEIRDSKTAFGGHADRRLALTAVQFTAFLATTQAATEEP